MVIDFSDDLRGGMTICFAPESYWPVTLSGLRLTSSGLPCTNSF